MKNQRNRGQANANRAKYQGAGYPASQLGPSGKPKSHVKRYPSKKEALQAAKRESKQKRQAEKHGPHKHLPYKHAHAVNDKGKIPQTKVGHSKTKHAWGGKSTARAQQAHQTPSKFRQAKAVKNKGPAPAPQRAPTPVKGRGR